MTQGQSGNDSCTGELMQEWWNAIWLFTTAFALSTLAGIFKQLRNGKRRKVSDLAVAGGYAGCAGLATSLVCHRYFIDDPRLLLGLCMFSGLAGAHGIDQVMVLVKKVVAIYDAGQKEE